MLVFVLVGLLVAAAHVALTIAITHRLFRNEPSFWFFCLITISTAGLLGWCLFFGFFFSEQHMWPEYVRRDWPVHDFEVLAVRNADTECGGLYCMCAESWSAESCDDLMAARTTGYCGNGGYCCLENSFKVCFEHVANNLCRSVWGTCPGLVATLSFAEHLGRTESAERTEITRTCSMNNAKCNATLWRDYAVNTTFRARLNPDDWTDVEPVTGYAASDLRGFVSGLVLIGQCYAVFAVIGFKRLICCNKFIWGAKGKKQTGSQDMEMQPFFQVR